MRQLEEACLAEVAMERVNSGASEKVAVVEVVAQMVKEVDQVVVWEVVKEESSAAAKVEARSMRQRPRRFPPSRRRRTAGCQNRRRGSVPCFFGGRTCLEKYNQIQDSRW